MINQDHERKSNEQIRVQAREAFLRGLKDGRLAEGLRTIVKEREQEENGDVNDFKNVKSKLNPSKYRLLSTVQTSTD